jgi:hypothetical protein
MHALSSAIQMDAAVAEEAPRAQLASQLTKLLSTTHDENLMDAIGTLLAALSEASLQKERLITVCYPDIGNVLIHEGALGDGLGARLWGISHRMNLLLIKHKHLIKGFEVLELGSGVGSTGVYLLFSEANRTEDLDHFKVTRKITKPFPLRCTYTGYRTF